MLRLYNLIANIFYFIIYPYAGFKASREDKFWQGRLGKLKETESCDLWLHAASVGEIRVIGYLINYILEKEPNAKIHLTTMTKTGHKTAGELYKDLITVSYFPYDHKSAIRNTLNILKPKLIIIAETEIWPNLIMEASHRKTPMILVNGRMSENSFSNYKKIRQTMSGLLNKYDRLFLKTEDDQNRYGYFLKNFSEKTLISGDMKFDAPITEHSEDALSKTRDSLGFKAEDFIFTAGSTRPGEEKLLINVYKKIKHPLFKMIIAPRHLERIDELKQYLQSEDIEFDLFDSPDKSNSVILINKLGVLNQLYAVSNIAFVGGTLVNIGGHNLLEPVWAGIPVLFGPSIDNVKEAAEHINCHNYGQKINSTLELLEVLNKFISGEISYNKKTAHDLENSATQVAGEYILQKLKKL